MSFKIRRHLANGEFKGFWQIKSATRQPQYFAPDTTIFVSGVKLKNQKGTAKKILAGENKTVCAWVECQSFFVLEQPVDNDGQKK